MNNTQSVSKPINWNDENLWRKKIIKTEKNTEKKKETETKKKKNKIAYEIENIHIYYTLHI